MDDIVNISMVTLQEYKAKKAEETALSDVDFRKAQLIARNPRNTEANTSMAHYNPITKKPYLVPGVVVNPKYDIKPLDMLSRQLNNESIEATNEYNPVIRDTNVSEGNKRERGYKTHYWFGKYSQVLIIGPLEPEKPKKLWEMDSLITYHKNDLSESFFFDSLKNIPYTAPQDDSYLRMQLTLAQMDANDGKLSQYVVNLTQENMWALIQKCEVTNLPVSVIQTPEGLEQALTAIDAQKPEVKILPYLTEIFKKNNTRPSRLDELCFKPSIEDKIINSSPFKNRDSEFDEFGFRRSKTTPLDRNISIIDYDRRPKENREKFPVRYDENNWRN